MKRLAAFAVLAGVAGLLSADDKTDKPPDAPLVRAEVRVDARARPDLSGTWKLNTDLSEDPREKMQEARGSSGVSGRTAGPRQPATVPALRSSSTACS